MRDNERMRAMKPAYGTTENAERPGNGKGKRPAGAEGRRFIPALLAASVIGGMTIAGAAETRAAEIISRGSSEFAGESLMEAETPGGARATGAGFTVGGTKVDGQLLLIPDTDAPPQRDMGYTKQDVEHKVAALLSFIPDPARRAVTEQYYVNSCWYDPSRLLEEPAGGSYAMTIYSGTTAEYDAAYMAAMEGLAFFSSPTIAFLAQGEDNMVVAIDTGTRFTPERAAENYQALIRLEQIVSQVQSAVSSMNTTDRAKYICDYVAGRLTYDENYQKNCLYEAVTGGVTACVGYNALTRILFEKCGMPYISTIAMEKNGTMQHIFGTAKLKGTWLIFDPTNYDQDYGTEPYWIYSDTYRQGQYYDDIQLLERQEDR